MVILRIWPPSPKKPHAEGFASLEVSGVYMSVRRLSPEVLLTRKDKTATLRDDIAAEGEDTPPVWVFHRLDETSMIHTWEHYEGDVSSQWNGAMIARNNCFRFCDMVLAAGRKHCISATSGESLTRRAAGAVTLAELATSDTALAGRAERYLKVERW